MSSPAWIFGGQTREEFDSFYEKQMQRLVDMHAEYTSEELSQMMSDAQARHAKARENQRRSGLASDKIYIEDASVRIENLKYIIAKREE